MLKITKKSKVFDLVLSSMRRLGSFLDHNWETVILTDIY